MTSTKFNISEAARVVSKSRATIQRALKAGTISASVDSRGRRTIDAAELLRVFPDDVNLERVAGGNEEGAGHSLMELQASKKIEAMQEKLESQYKAEIERLEEALRRAQEGSTKMVALLEDQTGKRSEWQASIERMAEEAANRQKENEHEIKKLKRMLHAEREKTFLQRLFGGAGRSGGK